MLESGDYAHALTSMSFNKISAQASFPDEGNSDVLIVVRSLGDDLRHTGKLLDLKSSLEGGTLDSVCRHTKLVAVGQDHSIGSLS